MSKIYLQDSDSIEEQNCNGEERPADVLENESEEESVTQEPEKIFEKSASSEKKGTFVT